MKPKVLLVIGLLGFVCVASSLDLAQENTAAMHVSAVPNLISYSGVLKNAGGHEVTSLTGVTFLIYKDEQGGAPLWVETQNVQPDRTGHYTTQLGATTARGIPADLFQNGQGRWLAVQVANEPEQARVMLVAVPYAMKAGDAETIGGLPASAFVLAAPPSGAASASGTSAAGSTSVIPPPASNVTTSGGTVGTLPLFTTANNIQSAAVTQTGSGSSAKIGINTATPQATLDVAGGVTVRGLLNLPSTGAASASGGKNSQPEQFVASAFDSSTVTAVAQKFEWLAEPVNNNTSTASGTLNLLYSAGGVPAETGLKINSKGRFTFAAGQSFPGAITTVNAGTDLLLSGAPPAVTLSLDTTKVPRLAVANTFTANQTVNGTLTATSFSGNGAAVNNVNAAKLGGFAAGAFARLAAANTFTNNQLITGTGSGFSLIVQPPNAATGSGLGGSNALEALGSSADPNGLKTGGVGITAFGGAGGTLNVSGNGGNAINAAGGEAGNGNGGIGVSVSGGFGVGGDLVSDGNGGAGVVATGGDSEFLYGGNGVQATGGAGGTGNNFASTAGNGVVGTGGAGGFQEADGDGGFFTGGTAGGFGGFGMEVFAGSDSAAYFQGDIIVTGAISAGTKDFKIDHPLDPGNKYLYHASVESSEMMNIYTGNVTTDASGDASVQLPDWFEAVNADFRYQLTVIGQFAQAIVSSRVSNHQFAIKTDKPNVDVSWQITAVRHDAFAKAHPLVVEVSKVARERGFYLHPELYGAAPEKGVAWSRHPETMRHVKALQQHRNIARTLRPSR